MCSLRLHDTTRHASCRFHTPECRERLVPQVLRTDVPARLERLPWGRFHTLVIVALGITWILDGLEVTLAGSVAGALQDEPRAAFYRTPTSASPAAPTSPAPCSARCVFGWLTDRLGRKKLFFITLALYLVATAATAFSWNPASFLALPLPHRRGNRWRIHGDQLDHPGTCAGALARLDGSRHQRHFWIGAALGAGGSLVLLDPALLPPDMGWRACFLDRRGRSALAILFMRIWVPESPRWLLIAWPDEGSPRDRRRHRKALSRRRARAAPIADAEAMRSARTRRTRRLAKCSRRCSTCIAPRTLVGLALMAAQAFFYNAIFFTYALVLTDFYHVPGDQRRLVYPAVRARQLSRPAAARATFRHDRPTQDDRLDLRFVRHPARAQRLSVRARHADGGEQTIAGW